MVVGWLVCLYLGLSAYFSPCFFFFLHLVRSGDFGKIRNTFKQLMRHYVHALFEERLQPKCIHGAYVTGEELLTYVKAYTTVFCEAKAFPECKTLLNAVAVSPSNEFVVANRP